MNRPAPQAANHDLDALVARYAPVGRRVRRERLMRRSALALVLPLAAGLAAVTWQWGASLTARPQAQVTTESDTAARVESALAEFRELKAQVSAETGALSAQREELARQRQAFEQRSASLLAQLDTVNTQGAALAGQMRRFEDQRQALEQTLARVEAQRRELDSRQASAARTDPALERQLADMNRQRRTLEEQQQEVRKQGQLLAQEIERINTQRLELERQRETIEQQRAEVQALLNEIREVGLNRLREKQRLRPDADEPQEAVAQNDETPAALATIAAVDDGVLGEMRGGLDVGTDFAVSIGVTRTGSVNGIEQFSSALYVDDLMKISGSGLTQIDTAMLQNGAGNLVTPEAMSNIAPNVATIIQNTLDGQVLQTQTIMDISLQNVSQITQGLSQSQAVDQSLSLHR
jgi:myosin heavy subunit